MILPPFIILLLLAIGKNKSIGSPTFRIVTYSGIIITFLLGAMLAYADYQYASVYSRFPQQIKGLNLDGKISYFGDYGFSYNMGGMGYSYIIANDIKEMLAKDDMEKQIIIKPQILFPRDINKVYFNGRLKLLTKMEFNTQFPVRVQNYQAHAGFYTFSAGLLPYTISTRPLEVFYVYELQ